MRRRGEREPEPVLTLGLLGRVVEILVINVYRRLLLEDFLSKGGSVYSHLPGGPHDT